MLTVVCHFAHFWLLHRRCAMSGSPIGQLVGPCRQQTDYAIQEESLPSCMLLGVSWQVYHAWNTYRMYSMAVLTMTDEITCGSMHQG